MGFLVLSESGSGLRECELRPGRCRSRLGGREQTWKPFLAGFSGLFLEADGASCAQFLPPIA